MPIRADLRHFYRTPGWRAARAAVRERAGDRCEQCGVRNGLRVNIRLDRAVLIQCGCAHLNNIAGDDRLENLAWLCRGCHLHHDRFTHAASAHRTRSARKDAVRPLLQLLLEGAL